MLWESQISMFFLFSVSNILWWEEVVINGYAGPAGQLYLTSLDNCNFWCACSPCNCYYNIYCYLQCLHIVWSWPFSDVCSHVGVRLAGVRNYCVCMTFACLSCTLLHIIALAGFTAWCLPVPYVQWSTSNCPSAYSHPTTSSGGTTWTSRNAGQWACDNVSGWAAKSRLLDKSLIAGFSLINQCTVRRRE